MAAAKYSSPMQSLFLFIILLLSYQNCCSGSLISSSEVQFCQRTTASFDPALSTGDKCNKKFLIALAVRNGKGNTGSIYADIRYVNNKTAAGSILKREQLRKPFRISVTKSDVYIHYPVRYLFSVNNHPVEGYVSVKSRILGINYCKSNRCSPNPGYCCYSSMDEKLSRAWEYKRGVGYKVGHYHSHKYSQAICMSHDQLNYNVFEIMEPYLVYKINVTVQQLDYKETGLSGDSRDDRDVWKTIGYAEIGPERLGQNTNQNQVGKTSGPQIKAVWLGDFKMTTALNNFNSKYLLTPDWRASEDIEEAKQHEQVVNGANEWLIVDRHFVDGTGATCNKIGSDVEAFLGQTNRCHQKQDSCFQVTPRTIFQKAKTFTDRGLDSHYFPPFYGEFLGPFLTEEDDFAGTADLVQTRDFQLIYRSSDVHMSLITLTFTAETVSFVENRSQGRIVEALVNDFVALVGTGILTVVIQNTGYVTADYAVSIDSCSEGILRVSERLQTIDPRQQVTFEFQLSTSLNVAYNHSCTIELTDKDGSLLDIKKITFRTEEGCIYCPTGLCSCDCDSSVDGSNESKNCQEDEFINPYWTPKVIVVEPCYHCWFTDSLTHPISGTFVSVIALLSLGMSKMLLLNCCCKTKDGRMIDVVGILLGTTSIEHTRQKQRSTTMQFLLGACFFVYLPLLPLMIIFCNWRRRVLAKKRLKKKAQRKKKRLLKRKQAALEATRGLMVLGDDEEITVEDAIKAFHKASPGPNILVVSSSSDSEEKDFDYSTSSEEDVITNIFGEEMHDEYDPKQKKKKREKKKRKR